MISDYYSDDELLAQLRSFFDVEEQNNIDFKSYLGQVEEIDNDTLQVKINNRVFQFSRELCGVMEVEL